MSAVLNPENTSNMKKLVIIFLFCSAFVQTQAQKWDIGLSLGAANYWGDLAPKIVQKETHPALAFFGRYNFNSTFSWKAQFMRTTVSGNDQNFDFNKMRNLSFSSPITEFSSTFEFNFVKMSNYVEDSKFTGFVYTGLSGFFFNPQAVMDNTTYNLKDYKTEGVSYSTFSLAIPMGFGLKYMVGKNKTLSADVCFRRTFTDYLDDVSGKYPDATTWAQMKFSPAADLSDRSREVSLSNQYQNQPGMQRGDPTYKDWFMTLMLTFSYRLPASTKCPSL